MFLTGLDRVLRDAGVPFTARPGWRTNTAHKSGIVDVRACMWHTTESAASAFRGGRDAPTLPYVERGLGYPLYNILIGRSGHAYLIAAGTTGHAGYGQGYGMPKNDGNRYSFAISFDANNTTHPVTTAQLETGARIGAAANREWRNNIRHVMHGEWAPARRSDPTRIPGGWSALRAAIRRGYWTTKTNTSTAKTSTPKGSLSMSDANAILKKIEELDTRIGSRATRAQVQSVYVRQREYQNETLEQIGKRATRNMVNSVYVRQREYQAELEEMIHQLAEATGVTIDYDKVREAAKKGAKEALEEGIDIEAEAEITFHSADEDQEDQGE